MVHMSSDDEIVVHVRKGRGYEALLHRVLATCATRTRPSEALQRGARRRVRAGLVQHLGRLRRHQRCSSSTSTPTQLERPLDADEIARAHAEPLVTTWEDQAARGARAAPSASAEGRAALQALRAAPRAAAASTASRRRPSEVPGRRRAASSSSRAGSSCACPADAAETRVAEAYSPRPLASPRRCARCRTSGSTVDRGAAASRCSLPDGRKRLPVRGSEIEAAAASDRRAASQGQARFVDALRALDEERATDDPLNALVLLEGLGWREVEVLRTLRNHLLQVRPHYNADTVNGVLLRNSAAGRRAVRARSPRASTRAATGDRDGGRGRGRRRRSRARSRPSRSLVDDEILRALENLVRAARAHELLPAPGAAGHLDQGRQRARSRAWSSPRPLFEIYVHSRLLEGIHLRGGQGRARRHPLERPPRRLPHRGPGPDEDPDGQELGHRARRLEGRLRAEGQRAAAAGARRLPDRPLPRVRLGPARRHRQPAWTARCVHPPEVVRARRATTRTWWSPPTRARRTSPTRPTASPAQYGFWLGDAFASGGSDGYDHKKEGITARGAWECVKHHFRNLGIDIQTRAVHDGRHRRHVGRRVRQRRAARAA